MALRLIGYGLLALAAAIAAVVIYRDSAQSETTLVFSPSQMLSALWEGYKQNDLEPGTYRTLDASRGNITTSEGESYTMLRAVWMGDQATFDRSWTWTENNLARPGDHLFAWLFGKRSDGTYGILTMQSGQNSASDADTGIALALVFAYARWQNPQYLAAARGILSDLWNEETLTVGSRTYVLADNLEKTSAGTTALINPSYLNPAAYRIFAKIDPLHPWMQAVNGAYAAISASAALPLGTAQPDGLPSDWLGIDKTTGVFSVPAAENTDTNFGYDALRVPFNLALDWQWFGDPRDEETLKTFAFLANGWQSSGALEATYARDGSVPKEYDYQTPAMYGGTIGYFMLEDPAQAPAVYRDKLAYLFTPDWSGWKQPLTYYDDNWSWFGIALYARLLPDLTAGLPPSFFNQASS